MASLEMRGPYKLTIKTIDREVTRPGPGNYALGHLNAKGQFVVRRVGRSDSNVKVDLKAWLGTYAFFKFSTAPDLEAIWHKHCRNFHDFEERLDDTTHPQPSPGHETPCQVCGESFG